VAGVGVVAEPAGVVALEDVAEADGFDVVVDFFELLSSSSPDRSEFDDAGPVGAGEVHATAMDVRTMAAEMLRIVVFIAV
jgi:hypothetical protein